MWQAPYIIFDHIIGAGHREGGGMGGAAAGPGAEGASTHTQTHTHARTHAHTHTHTTQHTHTHLTHCARAPAAQNIFVVRRSTSPRPNQTFSPVRFTQRFALGPRRR